MGWVVALSSLALVGLYFSQTEGTFTYVLLAHAIGIVAYSLVNTMSGASSLEEKDIGPVTSPKQKMDRLDMKTLQNKLELRNKKMETLVNELKKHKKAIHAMEQQQTLASQQHEANMKRLKEKAKAKLSDLQRTFNDEIQVLKRTRAVERGKAQQENRNLAADSAATRLLEADLDETKAQLTTANATITKLRNEIRYLHQQVDKSNTKLLQKTTSHNEMEDNYFTLQRSLKTTQIKAIDFEGQVQQLQAQKLELKNVNRALRKELEMAQVSHNSTKSELKVIKENYLLVKRQHETKDRGKGGSRLGLSQEKPSFAADDDDDVPLPLNTPFSSVFQGKKQQTFVKPSPKKEFEQLLREKHFQAAAAQVAQADDVVVEYILDVVTNELGDLKAAIDGDSTSAKLDDSIKEAVFSLVPAFQEQYQRNHGNHSRNAKLDATLISVLVRWADIFVTYRQELARLERSRAKEDRASSLKGKGKTMAPPPGFEPDQDKGDAIAVLKTSGKEEEYVKILRSLFPEISNLKQLLLLHGGDVNLCAESIFDELNSDEERLKLWFVDENPEARKTETEEEQKKRERRMRQQILSQYFMRLEQTQKCNPDFIGKYIANNFDNSKVRYRNDRVVSTKGERFIRDVKETKEQIQATSVSLAWVKRKRKGGQQKANLK